MAAAPAVVLALDLASKYVPQIITYIKQIRKKDGTVVTYVTIVNSLDESAADFVDNVGEDDKWFAANGMTADATKPVVTEATKSTA